MALRVLRLVAVASILALGLSVRSAPAASATTEPLAGELPSVIVLPPTPIEIPMPPVPLPELPPLPVDPVEPIPPVLDPSPSPAPVDPPADLPGDLPADPPPPPSADDPADDPAEDPDPGLPIPPPPLPPLPPLPEVPPLPPVPPLPDPLEPLPTTPPLPETPPVEVPVADEPATADPAVKDSGEPPSTPSAAQSPRDANDARAPHRETAPNPAMPVAAPALAPTVAPPSAAYQAVTPGGRPTSGSIRQLDEDPRHAARGIVLPDSVDPVSAGLVASLAVTNRAPSVAVAIEFGRAGSGWAGAIVFNIWLRRQLRERRMSQRQLAVLSGVDHSTISRLLQQDRRPSLSTATKLARALRHVEGETDTADYFERLPEESLFPARRVEMALRADDLLSDEDVLRLMSVYLDARRRRLGPSASDGQAAPVRALRSSTIPVEASLGSSSRRAASASASRPDRSPGTGSASATRRDPAAGQ